MRYLMSILTLLWLFRCSPVSWETEQTVSYCEVAGSVWYIVGTMNNLEEFIFYNDSVIIWQYTYSPYEQTDQLGHIYQQYQVMSIIKRKLEILDKDIIYEDGDGETLMLQYYRGYTVNEATGTKIYDWSTYSHIFFAGLWDDSLWMGMYDEFLDVQECWTFHKESPIVLDFSKW